MVKLLIVDACRSRSYGDVVANADVKSAFDGGAKMSWAAVNQSDAGANTYSIFSASEGTVSYAGPSTGLSVMTEHLVPLITQRGLSLEKLVRELSRKVRESRGSSESGRMLVNASPQGWEVEFSFAK